MKTIPLHLDIFLFIAEMKTILQMRDFFFSQAPYKLVPKFMVYKTIYGFENRLIFDKN
jgi:hypothetical protein